MFQWYMILERGAVAQLILNAIDLTYSNMFSISGHQMSLANVEIGLFSLPTERYKRNVVRGTLDLVGKYLLSIALFEKFLVYMFHYLVSMGGATGLFIGASLLSFVEILYYFTIRPYGTMLLHNRQVKGTTLTG